MSVGQHLMALLCVAMIASGQVMFKHTANALKSAGTVLSPHVLVVGTGALTVYALATILWIVLLQHIALSRLYPYMSLSFVMVSAAGWAIFHEQFSVAQVVGLSLIVVGLLVIALH